MRNVGFCGIDEITNSLGVIEDLERLSVDDRVPRDNNNNGELQHSFSTAVDEVFAWQIIIYWWTQKNQKNLIDRQNFIILCIRVHKMFKSRPDGFKTHHHYRFLLPTSTAKFLWAAQTTFCMHYWTFCMDSRTFCLHSACVLEHSGTFWIILDHSACIL